ncbi:MAG: Ig-like domain-containing protein, partial [Gracilibacteraceae bacterium]|nr:Ig-like domain-containing protein [Gracilibacteraceae bacterium]
GAKNNVVFIGDRPSAQHRERKQYIPGVPSESYENLYEPIWDQGENGTPVNDRNYYALYVYNVALRYKDQVKFWEIKNEPDFTYAPMRAESGPGEEGNWWDADPDPQLLANFHAPIQSYIRMLRVSYEVIKSVDPDAFVCVGGIGYASFLDAILRNTDNPDGGKVTAAYPYTGGAWFDCLSYHIYPMYYLQKWGGPGFTYFRHSDAAVDAVVRQNGLYADLLKKYGYDGLKYPAKEIIITETNTPSKRVGEFIGSEQSQRNYLIKMAVTAQQNGVSAIYPYCPWDFRELSENGQEYDYKGFYQPIPDAPGSGELRMHESGVGWRGVSRMLDERKYDAAETARLNLPATVGGGAFHSAAAGDHLYVLWAKTSRDLEETAAAAFTFPPSMNVTKMAVVSWDEKETTVAGGAISLTGDPVFIKLNADAVNKAVTGVTFSRAAESMETGDTLRLIAHVAPRGAANSKTTWTSANPAVARVDDLGVVTAAAPGETVITVKTADGQKTAVCAVTVRVKPVSLSYILLSSAYEHMKVGETRQLGVEFFPANTSERNIIWKSSDSGIVTVDKNGVLRAVAAGKVNITATPAGADSKAKTCVVQVN